MSCDEAVIRSMGNEVKKPYSMSLLEVASGSRGIAFRPIAFGEGDTKNRIKNVLRYKKPARASVRYKSATFDAFVDKVGEAISTMSVPCTARFRDGVITEAYLDSAWYAYGISYEPSQGDVWAYEGIGQITYDDSLFRQWADSVTGYLENCQLLLSSQEGELSTEQVSPADLYNYKTLRRKENQEGGINEYRISIQSYRRRI
jgi:hypothetical protein